MLHMILLMIFVLCKKGYKYIKLCDKEYYSCYDENKTDASKYNISNDCYITCSVKNCEECSMI